MANLTNRLRRTKRSTIAWVLMTVWVAFLFFRLEQTIDRLDQEVRDRAVATCVTGNAVRSGIRQAVTDLAREDGDLSPREQHALDIINKAVADRDCRKVK